MLPSSFGSFTISVLLTYGFSDSFFFLLSSHFSLLGISDCLPAFFNPKIPIYLAHSLSAPCETVSTDIVAFSDDAYASLDALLAKRLTGYPVIVQQMELSYYRYKYA